MQVGDGVGQSVLHGPLYDSIARLLRIELRRVGGQVGHREVPLVRREESRSPVRPVRVEPVPDDEERRADLPAEVLQGQDHRRARDAAAEVPCVESAVRGNRDDAGDLAPLAHATQQRCRTAAGPGGARPLAEAMSGFIKEDQRASFAVGLLF